MSGTVLGTGDTLVHETKVVRAFMGLPFQWDGYRYDGPEIRDPLPWTKGKEDGTMKRTE